MNTFKRKISIIEIAVLIVALISIFSLDAAYADSKLDMPQLHSKAVSVYCLNTDEVLYEKNANRRINPYSTTKVLTAYLAATKVSPKKVMKVDKKAAKIGESSMYLEEGEKVSVGELLYGMLLPSGNDAAYMLGKAVSGDIPKFSKLMNKTAKEAGCKNTHFINPNGIKSKNHYSTAHDMMLLFKLAISNDKVKKIAGTDVHYVAETNKHPRHVISNTAKILDEEDLNIIAVKTGSWSDESTMVFAFEKDGLTYVCSLMQSDVGEREKDVRKIVKAVTGKTKQKMIANVGKKEGEAKVKLGSVKSVDAVLDSDVNVTVPASGKKSAKSFVKTKVKLKENLEAPLSKSDKVGEYTVYTNGQKLGVYNLVAKNDVPKGWIFSHIGLSNRMTVIIGFVILLVALIIVRFVNISKNRKRRNQIRKSKH